MPATTVEFDPALGENHVIAPALQELLWTHAGRWVAVTSRELVAVADDPHSVRRVADQTGEPVFVFRVSTEQETHF